MLAVTKGHSDVAQVLVDSGANVDCTDKHLCTALHRAVSAPDVPSVLIRDTLEHVHLVVSAPNTTNLMTTTCKLPSAALITGIDKTT